MSITHTLTLSVTTGGVALSKEVAKTAGSGLILSESVPDASTDLAIAFAAVRAKLKYLYMVADQVLTIETNSSSSPANSFTLTAGVPVLWYENCGVAINTFLAADITSLFATNASGADATLEIRAIVDPT